MKNKEKLFTQIMNGFRTLKGKASCYVFTKDVIPELLYTILTRVLVKNNNVSILIVSADYRTRKDIHDYLTAKQIITNESKIKVITEPFVKDKYRYNTFLTIIVGVDDNYPLIEKLTKDSKFTLTILTRNIMNNDFITNVRSILPCIDTADLDIAIRSDNIYSPVEEHRYGVDMSFGDRELYDKYTDEINTSMSVFGDLDTIEKCRVGDIANNISSVQFCNDLAKANGWSPNIDTEIPFMKEIDDIYNPNALNEKACIFYNITKARRNLCYNNIAKLEVIKNIVVANRDKKILIVSKQGEFAAVITDHINTNTDIKCGNYHDCIENVVAIDDNNNVIRVKSGVNKGQPKVLGAQAQSTLNERLFNDNSISVLSIKSSSNTKLKIACNLVIITSPLCRGIIDIKSRFHDVIFQNVPTIVYKIYCNNTIEYDKMINEKDNGITKVIDETQNFVGYDENLGCVVC